MNNSPLGKKTSYKQKYDPGLLYAINRTDNRKLLTSEIKSSSQKTIYQQNNENHENIFEKSLPIIQTNVHGVDLWTAYEVSWLDHYAMPRVAVASIVYDACSSYIVESKSLKLYLNAFNSTKIGKKEDLERIITKDLTNLIKADVTVIVEELGNVVKTTNKFSKYQNIDSTIYHVENYFDNHAAVENVKNIDPKFSFKERLKYLKQIQKSIKKSQSDASQKRKERRVQQKGQKLHEMRFYSDLFRSQCPVTGQPDWATLFFELSHRSPITIDYSTLLKYFLSFRNHEDFHECCVDRIFQEMLFYLEIDLITICAKYTRRGGIEINPIRTNNNDLLEDKNLLLKKFNFRTIRQ